MWPFSSHILAHSFTARKNLVSQFSPGWFATYKDISFSYSCSFSCLQVSWRSGLYRPILLHVPWLDDIFILQYAWNRPVGHTVLLHFYQREEASLCLVSLSEESKDYWWRNLENDTSPRLCTFAVIGNATGINHENYDILSTDGNKCLCIPGRLMGDYCSCCSLENNKQSYEMSLLLRKNLSWADWNKEARGRLFASKIV